MRRGATDGAPRWASGILSGAQAALLSFLVVVVPAIAAYVATSADPSNADIAWTRSATVGAALWLLGHGAVIQAGGTAVSITPLGITALAVFAGYASARRSAHPTRSAWLAGIGGYLGVVVLVVLGAGQAGPLGSGVAAVLRTFVGAAAVAAAGLGLGIGRGRAVRETTRPVWSRVPVVLRTGAVAGLIAASSAVALAAVLACAWVVAGRASAGDVVQALGVDLFGGAVLAVGQLSLAPNLVLWVLAWLAGPGFAVGAGTVFSPSQVVSGPMPALPMLGALPVPGSEGGLVGWSPLLVGACGLLAGWWLHRRLLVTRAWEPLAAAGGTALVAGVLAATGTLLAGGSAGPGRLATVGGSPLLVGLAVTGLVLVGAVLTAVPTAPVVRAAVVARCRDAGARLRGDAGLDLGQTEAPRAPSAPSTPDALRPAALRVPDRLPTPVDLPTPLDPPTPSGARDSDARDASGDDGAS